MEYADDGDLGQKIKQQKIRHQRFTEFQIIKYFYQICKAVEYIHNMKIIHRDIKSQNIFLMKNGSAKLGDFGIAKAFKQKNEKASTMIGTPNYLSPEIIQNKKYDFKSDIWSLGVLLYELCMLKYPFEGDNLPQLSMKILTGQFTPLNTSFSNDIRKLCYSMLNINPKNRPSIIEILNNKIFEKFEKPKEIKRNSLKKDSTRNSFVSQNKLEPSKNDLRHSFIPQNKLESCRNEIKNNKFNNEKCYQKEKRNSMFEFFEQFDKKSLDILFNKRSEIKNKEEEDKKEIFQKKKVGCFNLNKEKEKKEKNNESNSNESKNNESKSKDSQDEKHKINKNGFEANNDIIQEFMKNRQDKIRKSYIISESFSKGLLFNGDKTSFNNFKNLNDIENDKQNYYSVSPFNVEIKDEKEEEEKVVEIKKLDLDEINVNTNSNLFETNGNESEDSKNNNVETIEEFNQSEIMDKIEEKEEKEEKEEININEDEKSINKNEDDKNSQNEEDNKVDIQNDKDDKDEHIVQLDLDLFDLGEENNYASHFEKTNCSDE